MRFFLWFFFYLNLIPALANAGAVIREEGAIYLEDQVARSPKLQVIELAPIYYDIGLTRYLGAMPKGQFVELQAVADNAYRVRGRAQQGGVAGWVEARYLSKVPEAFLTNLKQNAERMERVQKYIARNEVAINMTPEEVIRSLGKPKKKSAHVDAAGREEVWEYIRYEKVPQQVQGRDAYGRLVVSYVYVKQPVGQLAVIFKNNLVASIEQTEGTLARDAAVRVIPAPIVGY